MSSYLANAVSQAEQNFKSQTTNIVKGTVNGVVGGVKGAVANATNTAVSAAAGAVNNVVRTGINSVVGAATDALKGNLSGAVNDILSAPQNIFSSALSGLGGSTGANTVLSSPGTTGLPSSNGGVDPTNPLGGANARPDPMQSFMWYCQLPVISPGTSQSIIGATANSVINGLSNALSGAINGLGSSLGGSVYTASSAQLPWYYVEEASCPFRRYDVKTIFREGRDRKYPSKYSVDDLRLSIYADSQNNAFQYLQAWNNNILTPFSATSSTTSGGGWGRPSDYKKPIFIYLLDPTNNVMALIEYTECWPTSIDQYSLDSGTSTRIVNHVNFSVGDVFINLMGVSPNFAQSILTNPLNNAITSTINSFGSTAVGTVSNLFSRGTSAISSAASSLF
jgi:uncharacterized protein YjbJ (UPF0337 family)